MPNRLALETSPYLLQHANNPVDWHPWGPEALARAKAEQKPIFLSIGYSACHWCHVMEHESFENPEIARQLNEGFVAIKVDREERPDLDQIYMNAVQTIAGRGGWPMSVFLTPGGQPFFGGTYWPPTSRMGLPGFDQVLSGVLNAWVNRREETVEQAQRLTEHLQQIGKLVAEPSEFSLDLLESAVGTLSRMFDSRHGGFGGAPKFPHPMDLRVLLRWSRREQTAEVSREGVLPMVTLTLDKMAAGGIYDHLGGGFHRYSVDDHWLVPHFEKMLYDNALLAACYLEAAQATGQVALASADALRGLKSTQLQAPTRSAPEVARETLDYVLREMTDPEGGFYSTQDADSEGEEGKFYVWTPAEVQAVLGAEAAQTFCYVYDISEEGNFEGHNILNLPKTLEQCAKIRRRDLHELEAELAASRAKLLAARSQRIGPARDDKILVGWNGLMIDSLAQAAGILDDERYLHAATKAADFILNRMRRGDGRLLHSWCRGQAKFDAYLDDYAALSNALVSLYEASFDEAWIDVAVELADTILAQFRDAAGGGFYYTAADHEALIARHKDVQDSSVPSGNALAATALVRLGKLCGRDDYLSAAEATFAAFASLMREHPTATGQMLIALDMFLGPTPELVLLAESAGEELREVLADLRQRYLPNKVVACRVNGPAAHQSPALDALFAGKSATAGTTTLSWCEHFTCQAPLSGKEAIAAALQRAV